MTPETVAIVNTAIDLISAFVTNTICKGRGSGRNMLMHVAACHKVFYCLVLWWTVFNVDIENESFFWHSTTVQRYYAAANWPL